MTYLSAYMYRQISKCTDKTPKKHYWAPPPLATLVIDTHGGTFWFSDAERHMETAGGVAFDIF